MKGFPSSQEIEYRKEDYPPGTRVLLTRMDDPYIPLEGTEGTVTGVDDAGQIMVDWDNGISLSVIPEAGDRILKI